MAEFDIAEAIRNTNMYELACKTIDKVELDETEKLVTAELDQKFKDIGKTGYDKDREIAAFIQKAVNEELYNAPDEILDRIFDRDTITAADDFELVNAKNTLVTYEAAQGGNVPKSYIDLSVCTPKWKNRQVETEIKYADLEKNGWKTVAKITEYAVTALKNDMFTDIFNDIDGAISSGAGNYLAVGAAAMSQTAADSLALYTNDWGEDPIIVGYAKYIQQMNKLTGHESNAMKDELYRTGRLPVFDGIPLYPISGVRKKGDGTGLFVDKRVFGVAGKIGHLSMKGDVKTYETENNNLEKIDIKVANFNYGWALNSATADKVYKVVLS